MFGRKIFAAAFLLMSAQSSFAQTAQPARRMVDVTIVDLKADPERMRRFNAQRGSFYPERARREAKEGVAVLTCLFGKDGFFETCEVTSETPEKYGFGSTARRFLLLMRAKSTTDKNGEPLEGAWATIPMNFKVPQ